jgi:6-phosphogluconate dehydrogenase (decarboxylating)
MRRFTLERHQDVSGISGLGTVAEGIEFRDGTVVLRWIVDLQSTAVYDSMTDLVAIHGHHGSTEVRWVDDIH